MGAGLLVDSKGLGCEFTRLCFIFASFTTCVANAATCESMAVGEFWAEENIKIAGVDLSGIYCPAPFVETRFGISYYADSDFLYQGITGSVRIRVGKTVSPYFGVGVLAGVGEKDVVADADGLDNDGDGVVDEHNEENTLYAASAFAYPEVGVGLNLNGAGIKLSARRYYGMEFDGNTIYSVGISIGIGD